ncbi:hypothetical protein BKA61DRAFT_484033 [Leptodontidium sp. MPI-SDFR-AT-0119]|nr:hypothetical protein BKA61DRAFT_484033 [Leptodontidium sp. MPI-SDFR-AT-0119]
MFEHFTFGAQAQTSYLEPEDISASPTDCSFPLTSPPPTSYFPPTGPKPPMHDIADKFSQQTLYPDEAPHRSIWSDSLPSPDFSDNNTSIDDESTPEEITNTNTVACRRLQRQLNVQLQSCNTHIKGISTLVEDMLTTNTQCRLHKTPSRPYFSTPPPRLIPSSKAELEAELAIESPPSVDFSNREISPDEDEGFSEMDDPFGLLAFEEEMSLRRASAPSGIRKYNLGRWRKSNECIGSGNGGLTAVARTKVRSVPRMRRRKVETVVE